FNTPYRSPYVAWSFWQSGSVTGQMAVDRLRVHRSFGPVDISLGRFPINHSVTFLFTPNDFFAPFSATTLNKQYKPGVDAVRVNVGLGQLSDLEVLGVLGSDPSGAAAWSRSALTARLETVLLGFHGSIIGGKIAERWILGGTIQGDIKGIGLRAEGNFGMPDKNGDGHIDGPLYGQVAVRVEHSWPWHNVTVGGEYAYFSDGAADPAGYLARAALFFPDELPYLGRHYAGVNGGIDLIPILNLGVVGLVNAADGSGITTLSLTYNASNEVDLSLGMLAGWGYRPRQAADDSIVWSTKVRGDSSSKVSIATANAAANASSTSASGQPSETQTFASATIGCCSSSTRARVAAMSPSCALRTLSSVPCTVPKIVSPARAPSSIGSRNPSASSTPANRWLPSGQSTSSPPDNAAQAAGGTDVSADPEDGEDGGRRRGLGDAGRGARAGRRRRLERRQPDGQHDGHGQPQRLDGDARQRAERHQQPQRHDDADPQA